MSHYFMHDTSIVSQLLLVGSTCFHPFSLSEVDLFPKKHCTLNNFKKKIEFIRLCLFDHIIHNHTVHKKVSFHQICPTQTLNKIALNNSLVLSTYLVVNEESLYPFCSQLQQLSIIGYTNEACHQHAEPLQQLHTSCCFHFVIWHVICISINHQDLSLLGQGVSGQGKLWGALQLTQSPLR